MVGLSVLRWASILTIKDYLIIHIAYLNNIKEEFSLVILKYSKMVLRTRNESEYDW